MARRYSTRSNVVSATALEPDEMICGELGAPADFSNDFAGAVAGTMPAGWTLRRNEDNVATWETVTGSTYSSSRALSCTVSSDEQSLVAMDALDGERDVEILVRGKMGLDNHLSVCLRGQTDVPEAFYLFEARARHSDCVILKATGQIGEGEEVATGAFEHDPTAFYYLRARACGTSLKLRHWKEGEAEPGSWALEVDDEDALDGGYNGLWGAFEGVQVYDAVSAATNGGTAADLPPLPAGETYSTDFSGETTGALPTGWTKRSGSTMVTEEVVADPNALGGKVLRLTHDASGDAGNTYTIDALGETDTFELLVCLTRSTTGSSSLQGLDIFAGYDPDTGDGAACTIGSGRPSGWGRIFDIIGGTYTDRSAGNTSVESPGDPFWMKVKTDPAGVFVPGQPTHTVAFKVWQGAAEDEPTAWSRSAVGTNVSGLPGFSLHFSGSSVDVRYVGVGVNGTPAPLPVPDASLLFFTDFEGDPAGQAPTGWTHRNGTAVLMVESGVGYGGMKGLRAVVGASDEDNDWTWDDVPSARDVEIVARVKMTTGASDGAAGAEVAARWITAAANGAAFPGSYVANPGSGTRRVYELHGASYNELWTFSGGSYDVAGWGWVRLRVNNNGVLARTWPEGDTEPTNWFVATEDTSYVGAGLAAVRAFFADSVNIWDRVGVALNGHRAPTG